MSNISDILSSITKECRNLNIDEEYIKHAHKHAKNEFKKHGKINSSIIAGVKLAESQQKRVNYFIK
ncbi:hypothetical protein [Aliikangiella sp. IMCC44359]|uniref:hypothetical protein n=1 Tax=Aliikangiella sp. IMCC44359 TaxID=3459125 RepID=UPI00403AF7B6